MISIMEEHDRGQHVFDFHVPFVINLGHLMTKEKRKECCL
jgi:hypothetical protein